MHYTEPLAFGKCMSVRARSFATGADGAASSDLGRAHLGRSGGSCTGAIVAIIALALAGGSGELRLPAPASASAQTAEQLAPSARAKDLSDATVVVSSTAQLLDAVAAARPGDTILVAPGVYQTRIRFDETNSGSAAGPIVLGARDGLGSVVIDGGGATITIKFSGAAHVEIRDLEITGGGYHGVFFDRGAHHITVRHNRIYDNHRVRPLNSHAELKGSGGEGRPVHISIVDNDIFHRAHPAGGNFQGIDCNFCERFRIEGNHLHDIKSPTAQPYSYYDRGACIQMKSASRGTIIARNRLARCNIGIVYGGEGLASPEHWGGVIANNLIHDTAEMAIAIVNVRGGKVYHNTLFANGESIRVAPDGRHPGSSSEADLANNILDRAITRSKGARVAARSNVVLSTAAGSRAFMDPKARDFRLRPSALAVIDRGADLGADVARDYEGTPRPQGSGPDIGAFEYRPGVPE